MRLLLELTNYPIVVGVIHPARLLCTSLYVTNVECHAEKTGQYPYAFVSISKTGHCGITHQPIEYKGREDFLRK